MATMDVNTVILDLETYNRLKEIQAKGIENKKYKVIVKCRTWLGVTVYTDDEGIKEMADDLARLERKNIELENKVKEYESPIGDYDSYSVKMQKEISDLKNMSYWQFRKWRKS